MEREKRSSESESNICLTNKNQNSSIPSINFEGMSMKGSYREFRPGHWRVTFYWKGERFDVHKYRDGTSLVHPKLCERLLEFINAQMDNHEFDPSEWRKDKPFLFEKAVETWIKLKVVSRETLDARKRIAEKYLIPFFKG